MNLSYAAGFLDGEGCISFTSCRGNLVPRVMVANTNLDILEEFKVKFGGRIQKGSRTRTVKDHWKQCYHWVITGNKAVDFCSKIIKYLRIKTQQAACLFAFSAIQPGQGINWSKEGREACDMLKKQMAWLNKKGVHNEIEPIQKYL